MWQCFSQQDLDVPGFSSQAWEDFGEQAETLSPERAPEANPHRTGSLCGVELELSGTQKGA